MAFLFIQHWWPARRFSHALQHLPRVNLADLLQGRIDPATKARWLADQRTFAPWQYSPEAMMQSDNGSMVIPPADVKEQCHHLPKGYTQVQGVSERSRHRLLANGWHAGVARFMLYMVVMTLQAQPLSAVPCQPRTSTLQWVVQQLARFPPRVGPGGWPMQPNSIPPADDMWQHWDYSSRPVHPLQQPPMLPPGMQQTIQLQSLWSSDLHRIRHEVVDEISQMIMDSTEDTLSWWQNLPDHIRQVYYDPKHEQITQIPMFLKLLKMAGYPGLDDLTTDLLQGFEVLGELHPGCGWNPRHDERYNYPISFETFSKMNRHYVLDKLRKNFVDPHWKTMFEELLEERTKGRLSGPFQAPSWWTRSTRSVNGEPLLELPEGDIAIAFCFSVSQTDKTRRCEDLRRSGHNSTVLVRDVPATTTWTSFYGLLTPTPSTATVAMPGRKTWPAHIDNFRFATRITVLSRSTHLKGQFCSDITLWLLVRSAPYGASIDVAMHCPF